MELQAEVSIDTLILQPSWTMLERCILYMAWDLCLALLDHKARSAKINTQSWKFLKYDYSSPFDINRMDEAVFICRRRLFRTYVW